MIRLRMPRALTCLLPALLLLGLTSSAQTPPQSARQALIEMIFSKTPGTFEKHLPQALRAALHKARADSGSSPMDTYSMFTGRLSAVGQQIQTFDAGSTLMLIEDSQQHSKFEITVERDDLRSDEDEIELSFHGYKDGEPQIGGTKFRFTVVMKQEAKIWRVSEVTMSVGVSLTDPAFLKAMAVGTKPTTTISMDNSQASTGSSMSMNNPSVAMSAMSATNESAAVGALRTLNTAEVAYTATFPNRGFTCTLSDLGGMGAGSGPDEHHAMLIDPRLSNGRKNGYVFRLIGCNETPATRYRIIAVPQDSVSGTRAFCTDETAVIRASADGNGESCLNSGTPLQ